MTGTRTFSTDSRGQTLQDFTIGIGLFLITVTAVLTSFLGFTTPFWTGVGGEEISQADRIATTMVRNMSTGDQPNELNVSRLKNALDEPPADLRKRWGLDDATNINITVQTLNGTRVVSHGGTKLGSSTIYHDRAASTSARVVTLDADGVCKPGCRLVVRTW